MQIDGITGGINSITNGTGAADAARFQQEAGKFQDLIQSVTAASSGLSEAGRTPVQSLASSQIAPDGRLNGEYTTGFAGTFSRPADSAALPSGAAANDANPAGSRRKIDKTSRLYEKSMELESYFVKMMLSSMRGTLDGGTGLYGKKDDYALKMYNDMLYDELAVTMTKNAGFGLADQIYLSLTV